MLRAAQNTNLYSSIFLINFPNNQKLFITKIRHENFQVYNLNYSSIILKGEDNVCYEILLNLR